MASVLDAPLDMGPVLPGLPAAPLSDVVDRLDAFGDAFTSDVFCRRATWPDCGEQLKVCGGYFVKWLQASGHLAW
jgi:hypothetical protein